MTTKIIGSCAGKISMAIVNVIALAAMLGAAAAPAFAHGGGYGGGGRGGGWGGHGFHGGWGGGFYGGFGAFGFDPFWDIRLTLILMLSGLRLIRRRPTSWLSCRCAAATGRTERARAKSKRLGFCPVSKTYYPDVRPAGSPEQVRSRRRSDVIDQHRARKARRRRAALDSCSPCPWHPAPSRRVRITKTKSVDGRNPIRPAARLTEPWDGAKDGSVADGQALGSFGVEADTLATEDRRG